MRNRANKYFQVAFLLFLSLCLTTPGSALDTDVYQTNERPNVTVLIDNSSSMGFGLYEHAVNYGACYDYASDLGHYDYTRSATATENPYYGTENQFDRDSIYFLKGKIGVAVVDSKAYSGDAGNPDYIWYVYNVIHTHTVLQTEGTIVSIVDDDPEDEDSPLLTIGTGDDDAGYILFQETQLPLNRTILLQEKKTYPDGTPVEVGFAGQLKAPGWYFSGYTATTADSDFSAIKIAENGDEYVYFFVTGNWLNMQAVYNLYETDACNESDRTWQNLTFVLPTGELPWYSKETNIYSTNYPDNYPVNWTTLEHDGAIEGHEGEITLDNEAAKVRFYFEKIDIQGNKDYLKIYKNNAVAPGNLLVDLESINQTGYWTPTYDLSDITDPNILLVFNSDKASDTAEGFKLTKVEYQLADDLAGGYKIKTRYEVVKRAILFALDTFRGMINWAVVHFEDLTNKDGVMVPLNPDVALDDAARANLEIAINSSDPETDPATPIGQSLQNVFNHYELKKDLISQCGKNFCITITDGFPSSDNVWNRPTAFGKVFTDEDGDGWKSDPYQAILDGTTTDPNYTDDVTRYMYNYSFRDGSKLVNPETAYDNIISHMLCFMQGQAMLEDAADEGGGVYIDAYNEEQLLSALYSLGLMIIKSTSYVAPVISVDTSNKTQSGNQLFMAFFKPGMERWSGNLKKYELELRVKSSCPNRLQKEWVTVDKNDLDAVDCAGTFIDSSVSFWSGESDGGEVEKGGVGSIIKATLANASLTNPYASSGRYIYLLRNSGTGAIATSANNFIPTTFSNTDFGFDATDDAGRHKLINHLYGYTWDEDGTSDHYPVALRNWPLGSFIHSTPVILNYEAAGKTLIAIGGNDGMLHIFDNADGSEIIAFVPEDLLTNLKELDPDTATTYPSPRFFIDGPCSQYYAFNTTTGAIEPQQLVISLRRGGRSYYSLDVSNPDPTKWEKKWHINSSTTGFSELGQSWSKMEFVKMKTSTTAKIIGIFCAGYDEEEDEDSPGADTMGRGIFAIDVSLDENDTNFIVKSMTYSSTATDDSQYMTHAMPCDPMVITDSRGYLSDIYFTDLGGQIWHAGYGYDESSSSYVWDTNTPRRVFTSNPGSDAVNATTGGNLDNSDIGRKMFYSPTVTLLGNCDYEYNDGISQQTRDYMTYMLMVGTGDREKPMDDDIHDRLYMIVDDSTSCLDETDLFNVTMDEMDVDSTLTETERQALRDTLDDTYGWYLKLDEIADSYPHAGEKVLSRPLIFYGISYTTTFTPISADPCHPYGDAKVYALNYCDGTAALNYYQGNDTGSGDDLVKKFDYRDRYRIIGEAIPSSPEILIREGVVAVLSSVGGGLPGLGEGGSPNVPQPEFALEFINWRHLRK